MRRLVCLILSLLTILVLVSCSGGDKTASDAAATQAETADAATETAQDTAQKSADGVDIDLTSMSGTMVYSEVYNINVLVCNVLCDRSAAARVDLSKLARLPKNFVVV